jgi:hypothetical protein
MLGFLSFVAVCVAIIFVSLSFLSASKWSFTAHAEFFMGAWGAMWVWDNAERGLYVTGFGRAFWIGWRDDN